MITFDGTASTDADGTITNYTWNLGDGTIAYGATVTHSYTTAGLFNVTLTVRDNDGFTNTSTTTANIILDSDADGLSDEIEMMLGSNPENATDVTQISIDGTTYYLVDINNDGQPERFYNLATNINTTIKIQDGKYLLDINGDGKWEKIYDPASKEVTPYEEKPSKEFPWLLVIIGVIVAIVVIIVILFLTGYIRIETE
jgi:PKD repeat protein